MVISKSVILAWPPPISIRWSLVSVNPFCKVTRKSSLQVSAHSCTLHQKSSRKGASARAIIKRSTCFLLASSFSKCLHHSAATKPPWSGTSCSVTYAGRRFSFPCLGTKLAFLHRQTSFVCSLTMIQRSAQRPWPCFGLRSYHPRWRMNLSRNWFA